MTSAARALTLALLLPASLSAAAVAGSGLPDQLWKAWPSSRVIEVAAPCVRPVALAEAIRDLEARHRGRLRVEQVGRSVQGRPIHLLTLGRGPRSVLLWSQMHGDEPSATPALLDVAEYLLGGSDPFPAAILDRFTLLMVPMLNPDGAERYVRRNAQAIDINRDALRLATPEGRLLKTLRDRFRPVLGFNLHDQDRRTTVGETGRLATVALLAVAGDAQGTMSPGRARARRVCSAIVSALAPFVPGGISRYDEDWNTRAFGDNLTAWGTPVVLIESGGPPPGLRYEDLTRLNFVALITVLSGLARDDLAGADPALYERLDRNEDKQWVDVLVSGAEVWQAGAGEPYRADVAFDRLDADTLLASCESPGEPGASRVREVGDGSLLAAATRVEAGGRLVTPALAVSVRGLAARDWLDPDALARLGVGRIRWHVGRDDHAAAVATVRRLEGPGRPLIELAGPDDEPHLLEVDGPPAPPGSPRMEAILAALGGQTFRSHARGRPLGSLLSLLTGETGAAPEPRIAPDEPATLLVWRPDAPGERDPSRLELERIFVDGRTPETVR